MAKQFRWKPPIETAEADDITEAANAHLASSCASATAPREHLLYIVFSKAKEKEPWYNRLSQWTTKSDTIHVCAMLENGGTYSVIQDTNTVEYSQPRKLHRNYVDTDRRGRYYFCVTLDASAYHRARQILDFHVDERTGYDNRYYYSMGLMSWALGNQCIGMTCTTTNAVTCSRMVYDLLRDEKVGALDSSTYGKDDAILADTLEKIIQKNTPRFRAQNFSDVMEHIQSHQQASIVVTSSDR